MATTLEGFWKTNSKGQVVAQVICRTKKSNPFAAKFDEPVEVGSEVEVEGQVFTVAAIGTPFKSGSATCVYLYDSKPVQSPRKQETPDDPMDRLEQEAQRELGRTGELPGA